MNRDSAPEKTGLIASALVSGWILAAVEVVLGVLLVFRYKPTLSEAHASISSLRGDAFWSFAASAHYWASSLLILVFGLTLVLMLWYGWHRWQTRVLWWSSLGAFALILALQMTGNFLPLSAHDVRSVNVEAGIAGGVPSVGPNLRQAVLSGGSVGPETLGFWYALHRFLPLALIVSLLSGARAFRSRRDLRPAWFFALLPLATALVLAAVLAAPLGPAASPQDLALGATKPMWYVYPMHSLLIAAQGLNPAAGWLGAIAIPGFIGGVLAALPFFGRNSGGPSTGARILFGAASLGLLAAMALAGTAAQSPFGEPMFPKEQAPAKEFAEVDSAMANRGKAIFLKEECFECHKVGDEGDQIVGPNLGGVGKRKSDPNWFMALVKDPPSKGRDRMPAFPKIAEVDLRELAEYLRSLK
ncbi:MAG: cytochrome b N-terminal domain-containing protein [Fimbriimonadales bacterium]